MTNPFEKIRQAINDPEEAKKAELDMKVVELAKHGLDLPTNTASTKLEKNLSKQEEPRSKRMRNQKRDNWMLRHEARQTELADKFFGQLGPDK